jgi:ATPase subunit of ABC transporter with duplicated ATPase domains
MGHLDVQRLSYALADGRVLFEDVSFRVGDRTRTALVGANGTGKTTLLRVIAGDLTPLSGSVTSAGGVGVMRQFIGSIRDERDVHSLLLSLAPVRVREAGERLEAAELAMMERDDEATSSSTPTRSPTGVTRTAIRPRCSGTCARRRRWVCRTTAAGTAP